MNRETQKVMTKERIMKELSKQIMKDLSNSPIVYPTERYEESCQETLHGQWFNDQQLEWIKDTFNALLTDREIYERFMSLLGLELQKVKTFEGNTVVAYMEKELDLNKESELEDDKWTTKFSTFCTYSEYCSGAIFNAEGEIVKAYLDSHPGGRSKNCEEIEKILEI